ncbi:MAG: 2-isopropylmalate synthase [Candidatus Omnitrophica bacterium]|nr:2-isopropylmalate synthase [Candidatus Omnitrophota bacterium]
MEKIIIFDTTLRDGEQSPGASLNNKEKLEIAKQLETLGVDVIEAGFPASSPGDFESVKAIAKTIKKAIVCGLARAVKSDIDAAYRAVRPAKNPRIHVFLATSKIHMKYKLKKAKSEILKTAVWAVKYAKRKVKDVEFSPEDASRTDKRFLYEVVEAVIDAGATTVNIPDTVGYATPYEFGELIKGIKMNVPNMHKAVISIHCHNDLGLGVSNSLAAILNGARQAECTINGLGERAGNASLEEIVMAIATRGDILNFKTKIKTKEIYKTSRLVSKLTGIPVQPNKAIVGANAFAHEAGIHQDGLLKERTTYEIMKPQHVGFEETKLVLGKHSGRHALKARLKKMGYTLTDKEVGKAFVRFKKLADKKKQIFDEDLAAIVEDEIGTTPEVYKLVSFYILSGNKVTPSATVTLKHEGRNLIASSTGDGPVDACYKAVEKIAFIKPKLLSYNLSAVTAGEDALGEVSIRIKIKKHEVNGRGASTDVVEASLKAYLNALNKFKVLNAK